jgi:formate/nitrite transporter FocA (FNT family)
MKKCFDIFLLGILAGLAIAIGGTIYLSMENKVIGSLLFTVGLYAIVLHGLYLFTGKIGYLATAEDKKSYFMIVLSTWLGNLVGTGLGAAMILCTRINGIKEKATAVSEVKLGDTPLSAFVLAIFCGMLMYIAVDGFKLKGQPLILFACVGVFILCGFEHCIANMFYFSLAGLWSAKAFLYIVIMTLGNAVGAMVLEWIKVYTSK